MAKSKERGEKTSVMGYFRKIFQESPELLKTRSNEEVIKRWLADNPAETEMPKSVRNTLANLKSVMRKKLRKRKPKSSLAAAVKPAVDGHARRNLEALEALIDDALTMAKMLDREGLDSVIKQLRRARNEVVWKIGQ